MHPTTAVAWRIGSSVLAFLVAPGLPFAILYAFSGDPKIIAIAIQFSYTPALVLGIPVHFVYVYLGLKHWWHYLAGGISIAALEALFVHFAMIALDVLAIPVWAIGGGVCAVIFWGIAIAIPNLLLNADARHSAQVH